MRDSRGYYIEMRAPQVSGRRSTACILESRAALHTLRILGRSQPTRARLTVIAFSSKSKVRAAIPFWRTVRQSAVSMPSAETAAVETSDPKTIVLLTTLGCGASYLFSTCCVIRSYWLLNLRAWTVVNVLLVLLEAVSQGRHEHAISGSSYLCSPQHKCTLFHTQAGSQVQTI